jgi:hypothetical protein
VGAIATVKYWNGTAWVATQIGAEVYSQPDMPASTTIGALWIDTDESPPVWAAAIYQAYSMQSGYTPDRTLNPQASTATEIATVLATLIDDLKAAGIIRTP